MRLPLVSRAELTFWEQENAALRGECRRWKRLAKSWHEDYQDERDRHWDLADKTLGWLPAWVMLPVYGVGIIMGLWIGASL